MAALHSRMRRLGRRRDREAGPRCCKECAVNSGMCGLGMKIPIKVAVQRSISSSINLIERPPPSGNLVNPRHRECRDAGGLEVGENAWSS